MTIFENSPSASWTVPGKTTIVFPVETVNEVGGNRIVNRERPYRDGAKLDDVGAKAKCWTLTVLFENSIEEGNSDEKPLYPNVLNDLIDSFSKHETGDLVLPTIGKVRARAVDYRRDEKFDERDAARVELKFMEDNEDRVGASAFELPSVKASVRVLSEQATFSAAEVGAWDSTFADLNEFASGLESIANFPSDTLQDLDNQAGIVISATNRVLNAFTSKSNNPKTKARAMLSDPDSSIAQRKLVALQDTSARARAEIRENLPAPIRRTFDVAMTIFDIAAEVGQDAGKLIEINPGLDFLNIPTGTIVKVFDA